MGERISKRISGADLTALGFPARRHEGQTQDRYGYRYRLQARTACPSYPDGWWVEVERLAEEVPR